MTDDGCGSVTHTFTSHSAGTFFIVQDPESVIKSFTVEIPAPVLSVSTNCGLTYAESITRDQGSGAVSWSSSNYDKTNDVIYGPVYEKVSTNYQTVTIYTDGSFFSDWGKYVITVTVSITSNPSSTPLTYTGTVYALPSCSCRFKFGSP